MKNTIQIPPSKSLTHRALICASLAQKESIIWDSLVCEDTLATVSTLEALGVSIQKEKEKWVVNGGAFRKPKGPLDCNESGTTWRFLTAITSVLGMECEITGRPSLLRRPINPLTLSLSHLKGGEGKCKMPGDISSQFLSALLLAAPLAKKETTIELTTPLTSKPYVELTLAVQKAFGIEVEATKNFSKFKIAPQQYQPTIYKVEGDWSSAAYLLALGVLVKEVMLEGLNPNSLQGDKAIVTILKEMGGNVFWEKDKLIARPSSLKAIRWDLTQTPDLYAIAAVLGALAQGKSQWSGIERLRFKESNRIAEMKKITTGYQVPCGNFTIDSKDHRIIMAAAVLGRALGVAMKFQHPECVAKSWPGFWEVFNSL